MATTFEAFRDEQAALIAAKAPVSFQGVPFVQHRDEQPLRDWAATYPQACFRRFSIRDLVDYGPPATSTHEQEWVVGRMQVTIAYPTDYRYGEQNRRDMRDVMREDERYVDEAIGTHSYDAYTEGWCTQQSIDPEFGETVSYLVMTYEFQFNRSR